jgi:hypothetical protein
MNHCPICQDAGWLLVLIDGFEDRPAIQRCDGCFKYATDAEAIKAAGKSSGGGEMNEMELKFLEDADNSPSMALSMAKDVIAWMEHVPDGRYSEDHRQEVIVACMKLCKTIEPIGTEYLR